MFLVNRTQALDITQLYGKAGERAEVLTFWSTYSEHNKHATVMLHLLVPERSSDGDLLIATSLV